MTMYPSLSKTRLPAIRVKSLPPDHLLNAEMQPVGGRKDHNAITENGMRVKHS